MLQEDQINLKRERMMTMMMREVETGESCVDGVWHLISVCVWLNKVSLMSF